MDTEEEEVLSGNEVHSDEDLSESESEAIQEETDEVEGNNEQVEEPAVVYDVVTREHRKHQRMILQVVISAIIVVASGAALLVFRILRGIGYVVSHPTPSTVFFSSIFTNVHFTLHALRITGEILIVLAVFFTFAHRAIGFALGYYLRTILDPENIGQYQFHFDWISLRFGLDQNMLVLSGLEWRNPAAFTNSPYLLRIDEISFVFDPVSVYYAVCYDTSIKIREIKLDKAAIYIEKLTQRSIDRATTAAMKANGGLAPPAASTGTSAPATPVKETSASAPAEAGTELDADTAGTKSGKGKGKAKKVREPLRPGVLNLWAAMGATNPEQEASVLSGITRKITGAVEGTTNMVSILSGAGSEMGNALMKGAQSVTNTIGKNVRRAFGTRDRERSGTLSSVPEDGAEEENGLGDAHSEHAGLTMEETMALLQAEYPDLVLPPLPQDAFDEEDRQQQGEASQPTSPPPQMSAEEKARRKKARAEANKGFGVPYKLEIDFLLLHDVKVHAQDFLNASHQKESKASVIKLTTLGMMRNELTLSPDRKVGGKRRGIYLDDVVWRLVNRLLSDLVRSNSLAMMRLVTSAMASHTTSVVSSAGGLATKSAVSSSKLLNQAASSVSSAVTSVFSGGGGGSGTGTGHNSPARERAPSTASNNGHSSSTTQSALNMLNATGADVTNGARTALSSVGQFIKRTASTKAT